LHALSSLLNFDEPVFEKIFNRLQNLWASNGSDGDPGAPAPTATTNKKKRDPLGERGENMAARFLRNAGLKIIARNYKCPLGEIDIVAREGKTLVFVEVKTRAFDDPTPEEQVNQFKQHQLTKAAKYYLGRFGTPQPPARFDVVAIVWAKGHEPMIRHTPGAFGATF
jgi:putative endonuclease